MAHCEVHDEDQQWIEVSPGRRVLRCQSCHLGIKAKHHDVCHGHPRIKYSQNWHRDRAWNERELGTPFGKAKKPQL